MGRDGCDNCCNLLLYVLIGIYKKGFIMTTKPVEKPISPRQAAQISGLDARYIRSLIDSGAVDWGEKLGNGDRGRYWINRRKFILANQAIIDEELVREVVNV